MLLRVVHPTPGFFLTDARLTVALDGYVIFDGSFRAGFEVGGPITPGPHVLSTRIEMDVLTRAREYRFEIPHGTSDAAAWIATLDYSRLWGNFTKKLALSQMPP